MSIRNRLLGVFVVPSIVAVAGLASVSHAQPVNPPPTWGIDDGFSTSLAYEFNSDARPPVPDLSIGFPGWTGGSLVISGNTTWLPSLNGRFGVYGFAPGVVGQGSLLLTVHNRRDELRFKQVFVQHDRLITVDTDVVYSQGTDVNSQIVNLQTRIVQLANGWERVTQTFDIIPQPDAESFRFDIFSIATGGGVGIDNIYVHTHCIPTPSAGLALGIGALAGLRRRR